MAETKGKKTTRRATPKKKASDSRTPKKTRAQLAQEKATAQQKEHALQAYESSGTVTAGCRAAGISRDTWYRWKKTDPAFAALVEAAEEAVGDDLEQEAITRAKNSSDTLLIFLLKGLKPDRYKERRQTESFSHQVTPEDRQYAALYGLGVTEYLERKAAGTLPPKPEIPKANPLH